MSCPRFSVIIPVRDQEHVIGPTLEHVSSYLACRDYELLVVDSGSHDHTAAVVEARRRHDPRLRLVRTRCHRGKGDAVRAGVLAARGRFVLYTDAELQYPIAGVEPFLAALEAGADVVIGSRSHPRTLVGLHPRHFAYIYQRYVVGRVYMQIVNRLLRLGVADTQCAFKGFRRDVARDVFTRLTLTDFAFDVEALYIAQIRGYRIVELPVFFLYQGEESSVELVRNSLRMLRDLWIIRANGRRGRYSGRPPD